VATRVPTSVQVARAGTRRLSTLLARIVPRQERSSAKCRRGRERGHRQRRCQNNEYMLFEYRLSFRESTR
jgi:hypothetical protein